MHNRTAAFNPLPINVNYKTLEIADPYFDIPGKINCLLGADFFPENFLMKGRRGLSRKSHLYITLFSAGFQTITKSVAFITRSRLTFSLTLA